MAGVRPLLTYGGVKYRVGDLKVRQLEDLERLLGCNYVDVHPLSVMRHKLAVMAVMLAADHTEDQVAAIIDGLSLDQVDALWTVAPDDLPEIYESGIPLAGGGHPTPTS